MFVHCKRNLDIREGAFRLSLPEGYLGEIPEWASQHWFVKAAIVDGTISTPEGKSDAEVERAEKGDAEAERAEKSGKK